MVNGGLFSWLDISPLGVIKEKVEVSLYLSRVERCNEKLIPQFILLVTLPCRQDRDGRVVVIL